MNQPYDENRSYNNNPNRNRHNRNNQFRSRNPHHNRPGKSQRPLLTSAINGAGLALVALLVLHQSGASGNTHHLLGISAILFGFSSLISYVAQRVHARIVERISDLFFLAGNVCFILVAASLIGYVTL